MPALVVEPDLQPRGARRLRAPAAAPAPTPAPPPAAPTAPCSLPGPRSPPAPAGLGPSQAAPTPDGDPGAASPAASQLLPLRDPQPQGQAHLDVPASVQALDEVAEVAQEPIRKAALGVGTEGEERARARALPVPGMPEPSQGGAEPRPYRGDVEQCPELQHRLVHLCHRRQGLGAAGTQRKATVPVGERQALANLPSCGNSLGLSTLPWAPHPPRHHGEGHAVKG